VTVYGGAARRLRAAPRRSCSPAWRGRRWSPGRHRQAAGGQAAQEGQPPAPSSEPVTSMPGISRYLSTLMPVAIRQRTFTVRPASRTFWVSASIHANVYGRVSTGRFRKPSHQVVQLRGHRADPRPGQPGHPEGRGELLHPHGRDPQQGRRVQHRGRRPLSATAAPRKNGITSRYAIRDAVAADRAKPEWTRRDRSPPGNRDGQRPNPGIPAGQKAICVLVRRSADHRPGLHRIASLLILKTSLLILRSGVRKTPINWNPVTESNRRPSPYHGQTSQRPPAIT
jgi:hypothetical protein